MLRQECSVSSEKIRQRADVRDVLACHASCVTQVVSRKFVMLWRVTQVLWDGVSRKLSRVSLNNGSGVFLGLETSELCWRSPGRKEFAQLGLRGVAAGEEGVLLGAEIESTTNKTP